MVFVLNVQVYRHTAKNGGRNPQHRGTVQFRYCGRVVHDNSKDHLSRYAFVITQSGFFTQTQSFSTRSAFDAPLCDGRCRMHSVCSQCTGVQTTDILP